MKAGVTFNILNSHLDFKQATDAWLLSNSTLRLEISTHTESASLFLIDCSNSYSLLGRRVRGSILSGSKVGRATCPIPTPERLFTPACVRALLVSIVAPAHSFLDQPLAGEV